MIKQLLPSLALTIVLTLLLGLAYPFAVTGAAQALFPRQAHGSLIEKDGRVIGSELIAQGFAKPEYFHPRPSATTTPDPADPAKTIPTPYNAANSGGSNAAPTSKAYVESVRTLVEQVEAENPESARNGPVPVDMVTASGSGLDPDISPEAAEFQVPRVAKARGVSEEALRALVTDRTRPRTFGILGEATVNVLALNLALDARFPVRR